MKYVSSLFLCGFLALSFFSNALSQEKSETENPNKQRDVRPRITETPDPVHGFKVQVFFCDRTNRKKCEYKNSVPVITDLKLDKSELTTNDSLEDSDNIPAIKIFADARDADGDMLVYKYEVSGGKVIGQSERVLWDLTGAKAGTYTIKVSVDDGCNFCGNTITKTIVIK